MKNKAIKNAIKKMFGVGITTDYFNAIAKQRLLANNALYEPIDNSAMNSLGQAHILVSVDNVPSTDLIRFTVADWGKGMDADGVVNALQFGSKHTKEGYLCMYGVGLCNFLLVMTQNKYDWMVASKTPEENTYHVVKGPFALKMEMDDTDDIPLEDIVMQPEYVLYGKPSTIVSVVTDKHIASTMLSKEGNARPSAVTNLHVLRRALAEHLGVTYRGFLQNSPLNGKVSMQILLTNFRHKNGTIENVFVLPIEPPIDAPLDSNGEMRDVVRLGDYEVPIYAKFGIINQSRLNTLVMGEYPPKFYYLKSIKNEGMDLQLGRRTVASAQLETIWGIDRHQNFNAWSGYIVVDVESAKLPRGYLNTLANKSGIDVNDPGWQAIIQTIRNHHEMNPRNVRGNTLMDYCENLAARIRTDMPEHDVAVKYPVYANRGQVDVVDFAEDGTCELYNIENKNGSIKQLNRLLMGWNGMVAQGIQPTQATLVIPKCGPMLTHTVSEWNGCTQMMRPEQMQKIFEACGGDPMMLPTYNFKIVVDESIPT